MNMILDPSDSPALGATYLGDGKCRFLVWAPNVNSLELKLLGQHERLLPMASGDRGYFELEVDEVQPGTRYSYRIDGRRERPDPASRLQPDGVYHASAVIDPQFIWGDEHWHGIPLHQYIAYELHIGTFTTEGTFNAVIAHLDTLKDLGITAIELMPVAQFPGSRNWGYDGVHPFAVQNTYGGPDGLKRLVDGAHARGLAVILDVVYNHVGPEGSYLGEFGRYFTDCYHTPWGKAINFDGSHGDEVRRFFIENALYWIRDFHVDALRLDAIQTIFDNSAQPFLRELTVAVHDEAKQLGRQIYVTAETNQNDIRQVTPIEQQGLGIDAVWKDDFHHSLHALLTGERVSVYRDHGPLENVAKAYREGFVLTGQYSQFHKRRHGRSSRNISANRFVVFAQNHDQIGNRLHGERLSQLVSFEQLKLAAGAVLLSPYVPLLFMGEEYGETAPFPYFVDHSDEQLLKRVRKGRLRDYSEFMRDAETVPDPTSEETFCRSVISHRLPASGEHRALWEFHRRLIELRKSVPSLALLDNQRQEVTVDSKTGLMQSRRWCDEAETVALFYFGAQQAEPQVVLPDGRWTKILDSADIEWSGPGTTATDFLVSHGQVTLSLRPHSLSVYQRASETSR